MLVGLDEPTSLLVERALTRTRTMTLTRTLARTEATPYLTRHRPLPRPRALLNAIVLVLCGSWRPFVCCSVVTKIDAIRAVL